MPPNSDILSRERAVLSLLRSRYESEGYTFLEQPGRDLLPEFLGNYIPDAIAIKDQKKIAIEVKVRKTESTEHSIRRLSEMLRNHADWELVTFYWADFSADTLDIDHSDVVQIRERYEAVKRIRAIGLSQEAFVLYWPLFEAIVRLGTVRSGTSTSSALLPRTVVNGLEELGLIEFSDAAVARSLVQKRNALVHGSHTVQVSDAELDVLERIAQTAIGRLDDFQ